MLRGTFRRLEHHHWFERNAEETGTVMRDEFIWVSPLGPLGIGADFLFLRRYLRNLLRDRNEILRRTAESDEWRKYLPES